jgi:hypothetical protein
MEMKPDIEGTKFVSTLQQISKYLLAINYPVILIYISYTLKN